MNTLRKLFRQFEERVALRIMQVSFALIVLVLGAILLTVLGKGLPSVTWEIISQPPQGGYHFGGDGGILNAIVGSLAVALGAALLAFLVSLPVALLMNIHLVNRKKTLVGVRFVLDVLWGVPSIVYGAFAFTLMIYLGFRASLIAGIVTVTLLIIPIMLRAMDEALQGVPKALMEASTALGATQTQIAWTVYVRSAAPGLITAVMLAFGRGIGDAASVLFTAGYTDYIPTSLGQPVATLPLAIFFQLGSPVPEVRERAYAAAVVLTLLILMISLTSRRLSRVKS